MERIKPLDKGNYKSAWTCCFIRDLFKIYVGRRHINPTLCTSYMADPEILAVSTLPSTECVCLPEGNNVTFSEVHHFNLNTVSGPFLMMAKEHSAYTYTYQGTLKREMMNYA